MPFGKRSHSNAIKLYCRYKLIKFNDVIASAEPATPAATPRGPSTTGPHEEQDKDIDMDIDEDKPTGLLLQA